jgi:hypothetical protein
MKTAQSLSLITVLCLLGCGTNDTPDLKNSPSSATEGKMATQPIDKEDLSLTQMEDITNGAEAPRNRAKGDRNWVTFLGNSAEYQKLAGPELELVGYVARSGVAPAGHPEQTRWACSLVIVQPWLPTEDLRDYADAWIRLFGQPTAVEFRLTKVVVKAKLKRDRSRGKYPIVVPGSMRLMDTSEADRAMCWNMNMPLLPVDRDYFPISLIVACESVSDADSKAGRSGFWNASQDFKVLESIHGEAKEGQILRVNYSYSMGGQCRPVNKRERVIWVCTSSNRGYGAVADTPRNREEARQLAVRMKTTPVPTRRDLMDLSFNGAKVATHLEREVPALFAEVPAGSGKWVLRKEVKQVYSGPDGAVYFLPNVKSYFYRRDVYNRRGRRQSYYFGPYDHDRTLLKGP